MILGGNGTAARSMGIGWAGMGAGKLAVLAMLLAGVLALAGCDDGEWGEPQSDDAVSPPASPLLYEIANRQGEIEGWMLGTIHALPDGVAWRSAAINRVIGEADLLWVEVAELEDQAAIAATFRQLATTPDLGPVDQRIAPSLRADLAEMLAAGEFPQGHFRNTESWAAAITLAQVEALGNPANGVDRALVRAFAQGRVRGFETAEMQLGIFDRLAPAQQRALLEGVIGEWQDGREDRSRLMRAWLRGNEAALEQATTTGIMADPQVREALLVQRNRDWTAQLLAVLPRADRPLVAVGSAHLVGPDGLVAMLRDRGYRVRRLE